MHLHLSHPKVFLLALLLVYSLFLNSLQAQQTLNDWPRWRGPAGAGEWDAPENIQLDWSTDKPALVWERVVGPSYSGIAVSGDLVITMDRIDNDQTEGDPLAGDERIFCVNKKTGDLIWQCSYPAHYKDLDYNKGPRVTPTIHQGKVYTLGAVGHLTCLNATSGMKIWQRDLVAEEKAKVPTWGYSASPLIINDSQLIVHAALQPNGCFAAFDSNTGKEIWRSGDDPAGYSAPILIKRGEAQQLIGWTPKHIIGMSAANGKINWKIPYEVTYGVSIATPIYEQGHILVCGYWEGSKLIKVSDDLKTAKLVWEENEYLRGLMSQPLYREGHVYLLDKQHGIVCFNLITGKIVWTDKNQLTPRGRNPQASLVWVNNSSRAMCLNAEGELVVTSLISNGYSELSRHKITDFTWAHPAFSKDLIFARDDKKMVCYRLPRKVSQPK